MDSKDLKHEEYAAQLPRKRFRGVKRIVFALLMPVGLFFLAVLLLSLFGGGATAKIDGMLKALWLPTTIIRLVVYAMLAYVIMPHFIRQRRDNAQMQADEIAADIEQIESEQSEDEYDMAYIKAAQAHINARLTAFNNYLSNRHWLLIALLIFDAMTIQLPFFLRG